MNPKMVLEQPTVPDASPLTACENACDHFNKLAVEAETEAYRLARKAEEKGREADRHREQLAIWNNARLALEAAGLS